MLHIEYVHGDLVIRYVPAQASTIFLVSVYVCGLSFKNLILIPQVEVLLEDYRLNKYNMPS